jgi:hypothetical protein
MKIVITIIKVLLAISGMILGGFITGFAYTTRLEPSWLNSAAFLAGISLAGGCATYLLIKVIRRLFNSSDETK